MSVHRFAGFLPVFKMNPPEPAAQQDGGKIQPGGVIPLKRRLGHRAGRADLGNQSQRSKEQVHDDARAHHGNEQNAGDVKRGFRSVVFPVNENQRNDDQVGINK